MTSHMTANEIRTARGRKRTCQNEECGSKFYDLGRAQISCPACGAAFQPPVESVSAPTSNKRRSTWARRPVSAAPQIAAETERVAPISAEDSEPRFDADADSDVGVVIQDLEEDDETAHQEVDGEH